MVPVVATAALLAACLPGDRAVRAEVVNRCAGAVRIRLGFSEEGLETVAFHDARPGEPVAIQMVYPGPSTPLLFAVSSVEDETRRVVLPPQRAGDDDFVRVVLVGATCRELFTSKV